MAGVIELAPGTTIPASVKDNAILGFFAGLAHVGLEKAIPNLSASLAAYAGSGVALPLVASRNGGGRCYLASFTRMYMDGAADELGASKSLALKMFAPGVAVSGHAARALGMDDIVTVNNNLHPTCHVEDWSNVDVAAMTEALIKAYRGRAIWVRGLDDRFHADEIARLKKAGYAVTPSRPIEILDPTVPGWKITSNLREDLNKLKRLPGLTPFVGGPFSEADFDMMQRLTHSATVVGHSALMPHYSAAFFRACSNWHDCLFVGLRGDEGDIRAFTTIINGPRYLTTGTVGFDVNDEHVRLIYPAIVAMVLNRGILARLPLNIGYGALQFKRFRGTRPAMELNAFYLRHLPPIKRSLWQTTTAAMSTLAGPVMKRL